MALIMTATQQAALQIEVFDAQGNPAAIDGVPEWGVSEPAIITVEVDQVDPKKAVVKAVGPATTTPVQVNVTVDADLGAGVSHLIGMLEVTIMAGEAVIVNITAGSPTEQ